MNGECDVEVVVLIEVVDGDVIVVEWGVVELY